jgi:hypothetical protein
MGCYVILSYILTLVAVYISTKGIPNLFVSAVVKFDNYYWRLITFSYDVNIEQSN